MIIRSFILRACVRTVMVAANILALYLLWRGHNQPGGGFIAGLVTALSFAVFIFVEDLRNLRNVLRVNPVWLCAGGTVLLAVSALAGPVMGEPFLTQYNVKLPLPGGGTVGVGTPLVFDAGVYLIVVGSVVKLMFTFAKSTARLHALVEQEERPYASLLEEPAEIRAGHGRKGGES